MLPSTKFSLVSTAFPDMDFLYNCAALFVLVFSGEPAASEEQAVARHGHYIVLLVCFEQDREPLHL